MTRRDFMTLRVDGAERVLELSCEQLYMRFVDARVRGATEPLFARLERRMREARALRLRDVAWLTDGELRAGLDPVIASFEQRGGRVSRA